MRSEILQVVFYAIALVLCGAVEEFLPKAFGVGVPVLMSLAVSVAVRKPALATVFVALAAGAFEDSLSSLPTMASSCYFLVVAVLAHKTGFAKTVLALAFPLYQVWLKLVVPGLTVSLGVRFLAAIPAAALTAWLVLPVFAWLERKAAVDEA